MSELKHNKLIDALNKHKINGDDLLEALESETVYWLLRLGNKSPSKTGMDEQENIGYIDLFHLIKEIRKK
jgi:hypothetical protein